MAKSPRFIKNPIQLLNFVSEHGVSRLHAQGYSWFWKSFIPVLEDRSVPHDSEILSNCYYIAGDVCDFNDAPIAAISYYQKALEHDPENSCTHREIARMYWMMGDHTKTIEHSDKALELWPDEEYALKDRVGYDAEKAEAFEPHIEGNPIWRAIEHLAVAMPGEALEFAKKDKTLAGKRVVSHCYGALGDTQKYLETWRNLCEELEEIWFSYKDWFFMGEREHHRPEIWEIWLNSGLNFKGVFDEFEPLLKNKAFMALSTNDSIRTKMEFMYYIRTGDESESTRLKKKYPEFSKVKRT